MSEKEQAKKTILNKDDISVQDLSFEQIDSIIKGLSLHKENMLQKSLTSDNLEDIVKAQTYLEKNKKPAKSPNIKTSLFVPDEAAYHTGNGYKENYSGVPFEVLQRMGNIPIVYSIVKTRLDQIKNFLEFSNDEQKAGYTITKKRGLFEDKEKELSSADKNKIEYIVNYLEYGGRGGKWDDGEDLTEFISKIVKDSLTVDQATAEIIRDKKGELYKHVAVDGSTIRLLDSEDQRFQDQFKGMEINGFLPKYAQVWNNNIVTNPITNQPVIYYPWELMYGVRNKSTNIRQNGYGVSELEAGIELVTWILWGMQYNGNFFKQGSQPKGFINLKNGEMNNSILNEFRQAWRQMMTGVQGAHRIPVFEGVDLEWIDLQKSNRDMEFQSWNEFLIVMFCSMYTIDPSELGFHFKNQKDMFGQEGQRERLDHSRKKGLVPLLKFIQKLINKYIVSEIDDRFEFKFTGVEVEDEERQVELDIKKSQQGFVSHEDMFRKYSGRDFDPEKDTILNSVFQSAQQAKMYGGQEMNEMVDEETGEPDEGVQNPFEQYEKSAESDPIVAESMKYIDKLFKGKIND